MNTIADMVFETSWEVCNKCGGIYTVITSKLSLMQAQYDNYYLIGPLFETLPNDFIQHEPPAPLSRVFAELEAQGIHCVYGTWDIMSKPNTILINAKSLFSQINDIKGYLWRNFGIDSLSAAYDFNEPLAWSWGVGKFLELVSKQFPEDKIVGHFHEWLSGFAALYLKDKNSSVATVFTTHATMLGRTLSSKNTNLFEMLDSINPEQEAKNNGVMDKFSTERACALNADVFTTVSEITAKECEAFFGRKPDVLPNGLAIDQFPTFEETSLKHRHFKKKIQQFIMSHFFPYQTFDLDKTKLFYFGGRYEFENKGIDVTLEALSKLNTHLKETGSQTTVIMFFLMAMHSNGPKGELLENKSLVQGLSSRVQEHADYFLKRVILDVLTDDSVHIDVLPPAYVKRLRRDFSFVKRTGNPLLCTHNIDEGNDPLIKKCHDLHLTNNPDDRVKIVYIPAYLTGGDGLLNMEYYEMVSGCHLGIFPSYYEPWGYTPLESIAFGVPAITTNTAGFGQYMRDKVVGNHKGLFILDRQQEWSGVIQDLYDLFHTFVHFNKSTRVACKMNAHALSTFADWRQLIRNYLAAHNKAIQEKTLRGFNS